MCIVVPRLWSLAVKHLIGLILLALLIPTTALAGPCTADKRKFCKEVMDAGGKVGECLEQHKDELSDGCKAYREEKAMKNAPAEPKPE